MFSAGARGLDVPDDKPRRRRRAQRLGTPENVAGLLHLGRRSARLASRNHARPLPAPPVPPFGRVTCADPARWWCGRGSARLDGRDVVLALDVGGPARNRASSMATGTVLVPTARPHPSLDARGALGRRDLVARPRGRRPDAPLYDSIGIGCGGRWMARGQGLSDQHPRLARLPAAGPCGHGTPAAVPRRSQRHRRARRRSPSTGGARVGVRHVLGMVVSTGVGGGLVIGGRRRVDGGTGNAVHVGHVVVDDCSGPVPGGRGCVEAIARGPAMAGTPSPRVEGADRRRRRRRARSGDPRASRRSAATGRAVGPRHRLSACAVLDLDVVTIGGGVAQAGELFFGPVRRSTFDSTPAAFIRRCEDRAPRLGPLAGLSTAPRLVLDEVADPSAQRRFASARRQADPRCPVRAALASATGRRREGTVGAGQPIDVRDMRSIRHCSVGVLAIGATVRANPTRAVARRVDVPLRPRSTSGCRCCTTTHERGRACSCPLLERRVPSRPGAPEQDSHHEHSADRDGHRRRARLSRAEVSVSALRRLDERRGARRFVELDDPRRRVSSAPRRQEAGGRPLGRAIAFSHQEEWGGDRRAHFHGANIPRGTRWASPSRDDPRAASAETDRAYMQRQLPLLVRSTSARTSRSCSARREAYRSRHSSTAPDPRARWGSARAGASSGDRSRGRRVSGLASRLDLHAPVHDIPARQVRPERGDETSIASVPRERLPRRRKAPAAEASERHRRRHPCAAGPARSRPNLPALVEPALRQRTTSRAKPQLGSRLPDPRRPED